MNQNLPTERNSICNRTHIYFHFFKEANLIVFLQYKTTGEIEFEEYLGLPARHLEEQNLGTVLTATKKHILKICLKI